MIRIVADANVYVSAAISRRGGPNMGIIEAAQRGEITLIVNETLIAEVSEVLERDKFRKWLTLVEATDFVDGITLLGEWAADRPPGDVPAVCDDPDDNYLVALCEDADCSVLVSGDKAVRRIDYPNIKIYSPPEAAGVIAYRHEWGEGFLPTDFESSRRQMEVQGSGCLIELYSAFCSIFREVSSAAEAEPYLQLLAVPSAVPGFCEQFNEVRELLKDRGVSTHPVYPAPDIAYLKLPPDPGEHIFYADGTGQLPAETIYLTLQRCPDLPSPPELTANHWRVFGVGGWPVEEVPPRPSSE